MKAHTRTAVALQWLAAETAGHPLKVTAFDVLYPLLLLLTKHFVVGGVKLTLPSENRTNVCRQSTAMSIK